jgi:hypothetical protein
MIVRRRSELVEAVQWHKPGDHPWVYQTEQGRREGYWLIDSGSMSFAVLPACWIVPDSAGFRVLSPEAFEREYERVG